MKFSNPAKALCFCLCIFSLLAFKDHRTSTVPYPKIFKNPPADFAVHTWWHWMDNAISREGITADLEAMKREGVSTATILNASLFKEKDLGIKPVIFNTPEWYAMFRWALEEAERLGIKIGVHNCDGWTTSGGPWIRPELSMKQCVWSKTIMHCGKDTVIKLIKPACTLDFYRDIAVLAYPSPSKQNTFARNKPLIKKDGEDTGNVYYDGNPYSLTSVTGDHCIDVLFPAKIQASKLVFHPRKQFYWGNKTFECMIEVQALSEGANFRTIAQFKNPELNRSNIFEFPATTTSCFRIRISNLVNYEANNPPGIAELELLDEHEKPYYNTEIPFHLEKIVTAKRQSLEDMYMKGPETSGIDLSEIIELSSSMNRDGIIEWNLPAGEWTILRIGYTTTGVVNGPATKAGTGLECDKMDTIALNYHFSQFPSKLVKEAGSLTGHTFDHLLVDSWECKYQNWTESFPGEFYKRRGYSIIPWLPVIAGEVITGQEETARFLHDYRQTIADLIEYNFYKHFHELCHRLGLKSHAEVIYGGADYPPLDILRTNRYFDVPMFEFWAGLEPYKPGKRSGINLPMSQVDLPMHAASVYGKKLLAAEAYTGLANYSESPWDMKQYGERAFCSGINQMVLHSYVHQPDERKPGTTLGGFGQTFNRHNPWWNFSSHWFDYHARVQYLLQRGTRKADLLCLIGDRLNDTWTPEWEQNLPEGISIQKCNTDILKNHASVQKGKIRLDNGLDYKILLLPDDQKMELPSLEAIASLVKAGAVVMGTKPLSTLSLLNMEENDRKLAALAGEIWGKEYGAAGKSIRKYGKGKVYSGYSIVEVLMKEKYVPYLRWDEKEKTPLLYIHKQDRGSEFWYMVNQEDKNAKRTCTFISSFKNLSIWDPIDGKIYRPENEKRKGDTISMDISFPGKASFFVVASDKPMGKLPVLGHWKGKYILKDYTVSLGTKGFGKEMKQMDELDFFNNTEQLKYHSGETYYEIYFNLPDTVVNKIPKYLSCGEVYDGYEVILNGQSLGEAVFPFYRFELPENVKVSGNLLQVRIGNSYRNRFIGNNLHQENPYGLWTTTLSFILPGSGEPLKNGGMKGPVTFYW
jgi:hypothetical protein